VTNRERAARWGHQGGTLRLESSAELLDAIERSLFVAGVVTQRIDPNHPLFAGDGNVLDAFARLQTEAGLLVLIATIRDSDEVTVRVNDRELSLSDADPSAVIATVHQLLHQEKILFDTEGAGL